MIQLYIVLSGVCACMCMYEWGVIVHSFFSGCLHLAVSLIYSWVSAIPVLWGRLISISMLWSVTFSHDLVFVGWFYSSFLVPCENINLIPANIAESLRWLRKWEVPSGSANAATVSAQQEIGVSQTSSETLVADKMVVLILLPSDFHKRLVSLPSATLLLKSKNLAGSQKMCPPESQVPFWSTAWCL